MKLDRGLFLGVAMLVAAAATGCKSSGDPSASTAGTSDPGQPGAQAPSASPAQDGDDRRARRHHRGHHRRGDWQNKRRAWASPGSDDPSPGAQPAPVDPQQ